MRALTIALCLLVTPARHGACGQPVEENREPITRLAAAQAALQEKG